MVAPLRPLLPAASCSAHLGTMLAGLLTGRRNERQHLSKAQALQQKLKPYQLGGRNDIQALLVGRTRTFSAKDMEAGLEEKGLTGRWHKDKERSDPMQEACDMVKLPWVLRQALNVLNYLEVEENEDHFKTVIKAGGIMDVVECYPWNGAEKLHGRRDKRGGKHRGRVLRTEEGPCIQVQWDNPHGGECSDTFVMSEGGHVLTQVTRMTIRDTGRSCEYRTVYRRVHEG